MTRLIRFLRLRMVGAVQCQIMRDRRAAVAIEFTLVSLPFMALVMFLILLGFRLYVQAALDYVASQTGRMLAVDSTQSRTKNLQSFQASTLCPLLSSFLTCSNVTVSLMAVTDYSNASYDYTGTPPFSPGQGNSLMLLHLTYQLPGLSWPSPTGDTVMTFLGTTVDAYYPYQNEY